MERLTPYVLACCSNVSAELWKASLTSGMRLLPEATSLRQSQCQATIAGDIASKCLGFKHDWHTVPSFWANADGSLHDRAGTETWAHMLLFVADLWTNEGHQAESCEDMFLGPTSGQKELCHEVKEVLRTSTSSMLST